MGATNKAVGLVAGAAVAVGGSIAYAIAGVQFSTGGIQPLSPVSDPSHAGESLWPKAVSESGLTKGMSLPLERYLISYPETIKWQRAQQAIWSSCMKNYGFESFNPPEPGKYPPAEYNDANMARRYGISDPDQAARYGYHLSPENAGEPPTWEPATGAEGAVFIGGGPEVRDGTYKGRQLPEGGCRGEAQRQLEMLKQETAADLDGQSLKESTETPEVSAVLKNWSSCMKREGYTVQHPYDAPLLVNAMDSLDASAKEIELAVADVRCKAETDLVGIWHKAESRIQDEYIAQQGARLDADLTNKESVLSFADGLISVISR